MFQASYTSTKKSVPDTQAGTGAVPADALAKNGQVLFPQQASLFYAGRIAPNFGAFVQMTYDGTAGSFGWDNTDIRYARAASDDFLWGISANNDLTVQDLWNTTPAWQSPFDQRSATAPAPGVSTLIAGGLVAAGVAGISVYGSWLDSVFVEFGAYHSAPAAAVIDSTSTNVVRGLAPYWRLAYERQWGRSSWEVGAYGVDANMFPGGGTALAGSTNRYRDWALDTQYQYIGDEHIISATATCIKERQSLDATYGAGMSSNPTDHLTTIRIGSSYYFQRKYGAALGYFSTTGSADATLYPGGTAVTGYANNIPDSKGWSSELDWVPYENTKFALQYTMYKKFNGGSSNYDGLGRSVRDNDTLYLLSWINF